MRRIINEQCLVAPTNVANCFSVSDEGYLNAIDDVLNTLDNCNSYLE